MTGEKLKDVFATYRSIMLSALLRLGETNDDYNLVPQRCDTAALSGSIDKGDRLRHILYMCDEASRFIDEGRIEKAMRWLGFVQGILWAMGIFTIDEMGRHNMPDVCVHCGVVVKSGNNCCATCADERAP